jgi:isopenicillin N synthase-like dioxygenase
MTMQIPLVDLQPWFEGTPEERSALAAEVDEHLQRCGFLVVTNHRVPHEVIDTCRSEVRSFFYLPEEVKAETAMIEGIYRGWLGSGLESNAATYGIDTPPDLKEAYNYGPVDVVDEALRAEAPEWFAPNRWPDSVPGLQAAAEAYWREARNLHDHLCDIMSLALGLPLTHLRDLSLKPTSNVTLNWYGPREANQPLPNQFRVGPHTDFGLLTVLDREPGMGGLQVCDESGEWVDAPVVPGGLTINTGDLLRRWTNNRWCSNIHRVLPPPAELPTEELISLVFFGEPSHDTIVETFDSCISDDNPAKYEPIPAREYLDEKMAALMVET